ncbi:MAG: transporter substrate-binding domain-containing protein [Eggerthellales bacterium]|nr:transporter substrate-binding domain-containing protein [Eggerthellales bacterium]
MSEKRYESMKRLAAFACAVGVSAAMALGLTGCTQEEYTPKELTPSITSPAIAQDGVLRVGVTGGAPFVIETSSSMGGLDVDFAAAIADDLGLKLEVVTLGTDPAAIEEALVNGSVDMVMGAGSSVESENVWLSEAYISSGVVLFGASDATVPNPVGESLPMIAAQDSSTSAWAVTNAFGEGCVVSSSDLMSAFSSYQSGAAQFVAADAVIGSYVVTYQNLDVVPVALLGEASGYRVAIAASNTDLQQAVANSLSGIASNGIGSLLSTRNLGTVIDLSNLPVIETAVPAAGGSDAEGDAAGSESTAGSNAVTE